MCLGMHVALLEVYLTLGTLVRRFEWELFETGGESVGFGREFLTALPNDEGGRGVRVKVKG